VSALSLVLTAAAVPAHPGPILRTAPDGTERCVWLHGDEAFHYMTDADGRWLDERTLLPLTEEECYARAQDGARAKARRAPMQSSGIGEEPNIAPRGLVILVSFTDSEFKTPRETIDSMLNGASFSRQYTYRPTGSLQKKTITAQGSARQYFYDQSYGSYNPQFDVVGPFTLSNKTAYYGGKINGTNDARAYLMIKEACQLADEDGVDFKNYDNNNDNFIDFVFVLYAGYGEADSGLEDVVWPHASDLSTYRYRHDGRYIGRYACSCEMNHTSDVHDGIGTFCHEFSHVLGLPDLYYTSEEGTSPHTLYEWDIMDYGAYSNDGNTPPAYSAYERFYMGWLTPRLLAEPEEVTLHPINEGEGESLVITYADEHPTCGWNPNPTTFYMIEARVRTGWDQYLPGPGMLITKIEHNAYRWRNNAVNTNARSMGVDLLEAKANSNSYGKYTDSYPAGATAWTDVNDHHITNIRRDATTGVVSFRFRAAENPEDVEQVSSPDIRTQKIIRDGRLILLRGEQAYDILGRQL
jgi:M6 family metalloprotease-like protein